MSAQSSYGAEFFSLAMNIIIDISIFVASELFVRQLFNPTQYNGHRRNGQLKLILVQALILVISISVVLVLHHTPYVLILAEIGMVLKFFQLMISAEEHLIYQPSVSKPLIYGSPGPRQQQYMRTIPQSSSPPGYESPAGGRTINTHSSEYGLLRKRYTNVEPPPQSLLKSSSSFSTSSHSSSHVSFGQVSSDSKISLDGYLKQPPMIEPRRPIANSQSLVEEPRSISSLTSTSMVPVSTTGSVPPSSINLYSPREMKAEKPSSTPPGLFNNGNTCFVNSIIQCLNWTPNFIELIPSSFDGRSEESIFLGKLNSVFLSCNRLPDNKTVFEPIMITDLLSSISILAPYLVSPANSIQHQQDAAEFLLWLLNHFHCTLQTHSKGKSGLVTVFTDNQLENMRTTKNACMKKINEVGSENLQALKSPMITLSEVDWDLRWQKQSSTLYEIFLGQILEARECKNCKKVTMNIEYFTLLPLPIPTESRDRRCTLLDCLTKFGEREDLVDDNMIICSCIPGQSLAPATRLALLSIVPKCLILQLTRFSYNSSLHTAVKNDSLISLPLQMDFFPFTMKGLLSPEEKQPLVYELYAVCVHSGAQSTSFGHYMAFCKAKDQQWYHFNDQHVTLIDDIGVALNNEFVLRSAYLLFYHCK